MPTTITPETIDETLPAGRPISVPDLTTADLVAISNGLAALGSLRAVARYRGVHHSTLARQLERAGKRVVLILAPLTDNRGEETPHHELSQPSQPRTPPGARQRPSRRH